MPKHREGLILQPCVNAVSDVFWKRLYELVKRFELLAVLGPRRTSSNSHRIFFSAAWSCNWVSVFGISHSCKEANAYYICRIASQCSSHAAPCVSAAFSL